MKVRIKKISVLFTTLLVVLGISFSALAAGKVRIALGDVASVETLHRYRDAWDHAADRTPHGKPIELRPEDFG